MYDSFYDEDSKCPKCKKKITYGWQTKHLGCVLASWRKGDFVQYRKLRRIPERERKKKHGDRKLASGLRHPIEHLSDAPLLFNGKVPVHTSCEKCKSWLEAYARVVAGKFTGIVEIDTSREEKNLVIMPIRATAKSLREEFANQLSQLQESCKHEKTKWMNIEWAPGHVSGQGRVCLTCEKTLETKEEFEADNPTLLNLLKRSKRLR